jgi:hypothetical protein
MKTIVVFALAVFVFASMAFGQSSFTYNLNFERAVVSQAVPPYVYFLDWNVAAPGWSHSTGGDTHIVYYGNEHLGTSQYYLLMSSTSPYYAPNTQLAGNYSLAFASGYASGGWSSGGWINAFISQTLPIASSARSIQMLATGPFKVFVGGVEIPMISLGGNSYAGNIAGFAGMSAELKIMNTSPEGLANIHKPTVVDNIVFSPTIVPEPSSVALVLLGALVLGNGLRNAVRK